MIAISKVLDGHVTRIKQIKRNGDFLYIEMVVFEYKTATSIEYTAKIKGSKVQSLERIELPLYSNNVQTLSDVIGLNNKINEVYDNEQQRDND